MPLGAVLAACCCLWGAPALAEAPAERFGAGGYFRVMARPDLEGGWSRLGLWNISGRLLNEGPWAALELRLDALSPTPDSAEVWASLHAKLEGGSVRGADVHNGSLERFGLTQLYAQVGNVLLDGVVWQVGTLQYYYGDLGLYDLRPAELFGETVGLSATWRGEQLDLLVGLGDAGYGLRGAQYSTILSAGVGLRLRVVDGLELGLGGQWYHEPAVAGNRYGPHRTALPEGIGYEDYLHGEVLTRFAELFPGRLDTFPRPEPLAVNSYKAVAYLGFGKLGPLRWNNLFASLQRQHPDSFTSERHGGREYLIYLAELTDERLSLVIGDELQLSLVAEVWDLALGALFGLQSDADDRVAASEDNRRYWSGVLRSQWYLSDTLHLLTETSYAQEQSTQGNLWRGHHDSIFASQGGLANARGLEFGDLDRRETWQLKTGLVLNPSGLGIFSRPSIRLLYGLQHSTMHNAFGNSFVETLDQYEVFSETRDRHWHSVIAIETEAWF